MIGDDKCWPGDPSYDSLYGGNQSGFYPDETHFYLEYEGAGIVLVKAVFSNAGCGNWDISPVAKWKVERMSITMQQAVRKGGAIMLKVKDDEKEHRFKVSKRFKRSNSCLVLDFI